VTIATFATFGAGGSEPYAQALRQHGSLHQEERVLYLHDTEALLSAPTAAMDVSRWREDANIVDLSLIEHSTGGVLDIGCGPGRMVKAAMGLGLPALGIDVSDAAVDIASEAGLTVLHASVFEPLPTEGMWQLALLLDGNIGIGGDPTALLRRCRELISDDGVVVVEVHPDPVWDHTYSGTVVDIRGQQSACFPWAEIGRDALTVRAIDSGLRLLSAWETDGRSFCRYAKN
jgi:SAM-dependent methyltransferase